MFRDYSYQKHHDRRKTVIYSFNSSKGQESKAYHWIIFVVADLGIRSLDFAIKSYLYQEKKKREAPAENIKTKIILQLI